MIIFLLIYLSIGFLMAYRASEIIRQLSLFSFGGRWLGPVSYAILIVFYPVLYLFTIRKIK